MVYTRQERMQMLEVLILARFNSAEAVRQFRRIYPNFNPPPSRATFHRLAAVYRQHGDVDAPVAPRARPVQDFLVDVLRERFQGPRGILSARRAAIELGCNRETVRLVLKKQLLMKPYHVQNHQQLLPDDPPQRLRFARWMTLRMLVDDAFPARILFTDEATFTNKGTINRQNRRYWAAENPCWKIDIPSRGFKINVWAGVLGDRIIGPHFFDGNLTGEVYRDFLQNEFQDLLPAQIRRRTWMMQDGARVHTTRVNLRVLSQLFGQQIISLRTQHPWPPRSPDLTPLDFFVWPYVKERVYAAAPATRNLMCDEIRQVFATITPNMLQNVRRSFGERIERCIENHGRHVEHEM